MVLFVVVCFDIWELCLGLLSLLLGCCVVRPFVCIVFGAFNFCYLFLQCVRDVFSFFFGVSHVFDVCSNFPLGVLMSSVWFSFPLCVSK